MGEMPSTACCVSGIPDVSQQRVLLFALVPSNDLDKSVTKFKRFSAQAITQSFKHSRAQMNRQQQSLQLSLQEKSQQKSYQEQAAQDSSNNYFMSLGGGSIITNIRWTQLWKTECPVWGRFI